MKFFLLLIWVFFQDVGAHQREATAFVIDESVKTVEHVGAHRREASTLVINEVLFHPKREGFDYVEGYNRGTVPVNLQEYMIANRNSLGEIAARKALATEPVYLAAGAYVVITAVGGWLRTHYDVPDDAVVCELSSLPSFPENQGTVVLLVGSDSVADELNYNANWHLPLLADATGVALERIDYLMPTQDSHNWTSASAASGYGTPGKENSQFRKKVPVADEIEASALFSPDNDGVADVARISFHLQEPGFMANLNVYDLSGRKVRTLIRNEPVGTEAVYQWDGLDNRSKPLPVGVYILVAELFNISGTTRISRNAITLARR